MFLTYFGGDPPSSRFGPRHRKTWTWSRLDDRIEGERENGNYL